MRVGHSCRGICGWGCGGIMTCSAPFRRVLPYFFAGTRNGLLEKGDCLELGVIGRKIT